MILRNLPSVEPFVVHWKWPLFRREENLSVNQIIFAAQPFTRFGASGAPCGSYQLPEEAAA